MTLNPDPTIHRQVVEAARTLLTDEPATPISRIAAEAGVSRATFYRHFGSRDALLAAVEVEPPAPARDRVLDTAAELIGHRGLHGFSMEELAVAAGVSRATLYRLFPSKGAVFGEVVRRFSPFEPVMRLLRANPELPPDELVPRIARLFATLAGPRLAIMRGVVGEAAAASPDAVAGLQPFMPEAILAIAGYLVSQMDAGRIRRMHPILAVQALLGPIFLHLLTRPIVEQVIGLDVTIEEAADELAAAILTGLRT